MAGAGAELGKMKQVLNVMTRIFFLEHPISTKQRLVKADPNIYPMRNVFKLLGLWITDEKDFSFTKDNPWKGSTVTNFSFKTISYAPHISEYWQNIPASQEQPKCV